ncbi:hypothetical protein ACFLYU_02635 [Candidatus Dependentiae bacterium]
MRRISIFLLLSSISLQISCTRKNVFITNNTPYEISYETKKFFPHTGKSAPFPHTSAAVKKAASKQKKSASASMLSIKPWECKKVASITKVVYADKSKKDSIIIIKGQLKDEKTKKDAKFELHVEETGTKYGVHPQKFYKRKSGDSASNIIRVSKVLKIGKKTIDILMRDVPPKKGSLRDIEYIFTLPPYPTPKRHDRKNVLHIFQQNLYMRPLIAFPNDGQVERASMFFKEMLTSGLKFKPDVVVVSEVFIPKCEKILDREAKKHGYKYHTPMLAASSAKLNLFKVAVEGIEAITTGKPPTLASGGVKIYSLFPIEKTKEVTFGRSRCHKTDCLSDKGCVYALVNKKGRKYKIFATHTDSASKDIRLKQYQVIEDFINQQRMEKTNGVAVKERYPVIIVGDMNMCSFEERYADERKKMLKILNAKIVKNIGHKISLARRKIFKGKKRSPEVYFNALAAFEHPTWEGFDLDLLLYEKGRHEPIKSYRKVIAERLKYKPWVNNAGHTYFGAPGWEMSDHQGVIGYLEYPK